MRTKDLECYVIREDASLREAMLLIEENRHRSLVVVNNTQRVVGTISDGDIRKAMLAERLLDSKVVDVMNTHYLFLHEKDEDDRARALFDREHIFLVPVVDNDGKLVALELAY